ncbi:hypothetical protein BCR33DRAFT_210807 [Rhizoclosmatium globosum]|uniref:PNPLA domain-containing protein n=1 Tax=Rhizoclosmatium globosum TaxID=329046 RepID=A0A1Y2CCQ9_9FUNG|nr:hypothetical protein BCR33DRAFT_210807 [Rhizoclosmatium globosum]|eukprot:ORY44830.1 hypothetical protein BCR33DRAFT_210807 [Rhizoclosmatium globosum]
MCSSKKDSPMPTQPSAALSGTYQFPPAQAKKPCLKRTGSSAKGNGKQLSESEQSCAPPATDFPYSLKGINHGITWILDSTKNNLAVRTEPQKRVSFSRDVLGSSNAQPRSASTETNYESGCESDDEDVQVGPSRNSPTRSLRPINPKIKYRELTIDDPLPHETSSRKQLPTISKNRNPNSPNTQLQKSLPVPLLSLPMQSSPEPSESDRVLIPEQLTTSFLTSVMFRNSPCPEPVWVSSGDLPKPVIKRQSFVSRFFFGDGSRSSDEEDVDATAVNSPERNQNLSTSETSIEPKILEHLGVLSPVSTDDDSHSSSITLTELSPPLDNNRALEFEVSSTCTSDSESIPRVFAVPSTKYQNILKPRPLTTLANSVPATQTLLNVFRSTTPEVNHFRLANVDCLAGDESTIYGQPLPHFLKLKPEPHKPDLFDLSSPKISSPQLPAPPTNSVLHRRQQRFSQMISDYSKIDQNKAQDPFESLRTTPPSTASRVTSWLATTSLKTATKAVNCANSVSNTAVAATGYVTGNPTVLVDARDSVFGTAKSIAGWVFRGKTATKIISTARHAVPQVVDHAVSKVIGSECVTGESEPLLSFWKKQDTLFPTHDKFIGAKAVDFSHFYVTSKTAQECEDVVEGEEEFEGGEFRPANCKSRVEFRNVPSFSFSSVAGPLDALYSVGVAEGLLQQFRGELFSNRKDGFKWLGSGYGAIVAAVMALKLGQPGLTSARKLFENIHNSSRTSLLGSFGQMSDLLKRELEILIPSNVYEANHDNLHISVTLMPSMENEIVSHYLTRDELIQSLLATCYLPVSH